MVEFLSRFNSVPDTPLLYPVIVMYCRMFNPYGADSFILGLVFLTPLLSVGLEAGETLGEMQCAASNTFFPAHPEAEKGMGASGARYSLALCYTGLL